MTPRETSTVDRTDQPTHQSSARRGKTSYTVEADVELVFADGVTEVEPFRATVTADSVDDAVEAFRRTARERLVERGPFEGVECPPFPGYGDYRFGDE